MFSKAIQYLKNKWKIESNKDFFLIMLVFSLAGMAIGFERRPIFHLFGITSHTPLIYKILLYLPIVPPLYQLNLLIFGYCFGQFSFFWEKEKRLGKALARIFTR